jgi:glutamate---cysteine ligase / carboxylate-amine ligase
MGESVADPLRALKEARGRFEASDDFTIGIEEEFQILDPGTLALTQKFEQLKALADASPLQGNVAGELISSEIEIKTGRCATFAEAAAAMRERRRVLFELADQLGVSLAAVGTHPFSPWQEQKVIDTPHYRVVEDTLKYVAWRNNTFGVHIHVGIRGADRAIAVCNALRGVLPDLIAIAASSPWLEGLVTHLRSTRTQIFTRMFPRCGVPDAFAGWSDYEAFVRFLLETRSIREQTEIWWTVRPHQTFGTVEIRACDALADIEEAIAVCAFQLALTARFARDYDAGTLDPFLEQRFIEENLWRAIRFGLDRDLIDYPRRAAVPAGDRIRGLLDRCAAQIDELGLDPYLAPLHRILERGDTSSRVIHALGQAPTDEAIRRAFVEQVALTRAGADPHTRKAAGWDPTSANR